MQIMDILCRYLLQHLEGVKFIYIQLVSQRKSVNGSFSWAQQFHHNLVFLRFDNSVTCINSVIIFITIKP